MKKKNVVTLKDTQESTTVLIKWPKDRRAKRETKNYTIYETRTEFIKKKNLVRFDKVTKFACVFLKFL